MGRQFAIFGAPLMGLHHREEKEKSANDWPRQCFDGRMSTSAWGSHVAELHS